jgi:hypothetical protein
MEGFLDGLTDGDNVVIVVAVVVVVVNKWRCNNFVYVNVVNFIIITGIILCNCDCDWWCVLVNDEDTNIFERFEL